MTATLQAMQADPAIFREHLLIDADGRGPVPLGQCLDDWQRTDFEALDNGWRKCIGLPVDPSKPTYSRAYLERGRGHSKTQDQGTMSLWALWASRRPLSGIAAADDKDQARLLRNAIEKLVRLNGWLSQMVTDPEDGKKKPLIEVQTNRVRNTLTGSTLDILSGDAPSSYGLTPDFVTIDELSHWRKEALWDSIFSSVAKRGNCMLVIISNAGLGQGISWQWTVRDNVLNDQDRWYFSKLSGPQASWITKDRLEEQKRLLPPKAYRRLWLNQWTAETGDALDADDIEAACTLPGPILRYMPEFAPFIGALDLGLKRDHSALIVMSIDYRAQRYTLAHCESWAPAKYGGTIRLEDVEQACLDAQRRFDLCALFYDPWQALYLAERLQDRGVYMVPRPFTTRYCDLLATRLLQVFRNRQLHMFDDPLLRSDLMRLSIVERQSGFKLQATRDQRGHADRATALAIAVCEAVACGRGWLEQERIEEISRYEEEQMARMYHGSVSYARHMHG